MSFLMGVYDGDGSSGKNHTDISSGSYLFLQDIKKLFNIPNKIGKQKRKTICYTLSLGRPIYEKMINSYNSGLLRKRQNFEGVFKKQDTKKISEKILQSKIKNGTIKRKFEVSPEELTELMKKFPMTTIGKRFGVSDNAIRKRAKLLNLSLPKNNLGYWTRKPTID